MSKQDSESHAVVRVTTAEWQSGATNTKGNSMLQLDLLPVATHTGLAIGHKKAEEAAKHAGGDWLEQALEAFRHYATTHKKFTTEDNRNNDGELSEQGEAAAAPSGGGGGSTENTNKRGSNWNELYTLVRGKANPIDDKKKWESGIKRGVSNSIW